MEELDAYIQSLIDLDANLDDFLEQSIERNEGKIVRMIRERLYQTGVSGDGTFLGYYTDSTEAKKKDDNQRSSHITLRDTGGFYKGMFADLGDGYLIISSDAPQTEELISRFGEGILELNKYEQEIVMDTMIEADLIKYINSLGDYLSAAT